MLTYAKLVSELLTCISLSESSRLHQSERNVWHLERYHNRLDYSKHIFIEMISHASGSASSLRQHVNQSAIRWCFPLPAELFHRFNCALAGFQVDHRCWLLSPRGTNRGTISCLKSGGCTPNGVHAAPPSTATHLKTLSRKCSHVKKRRKKKSLAVYTVPLITVMDWYCCVSRVMGYLLDLTGYLVWNRRDVTNKPSCPKVYVEADVFFLNCETTVEEELAVFQLLCIISTLSCQGGRKWTIFTFPFKLVLL